MAKGGAQTATGSFDYDILLSLQSIQSDVKAMFSVFKKDQTKQYEESRKSLQKSVPKQPTDKKREMFKLPKLPNFKSFIDKLGDGILDFGKLALAGAFLAGLLSDKFRESLDNWAPTSLVGKFLKSLLLGDDSSDDIKERIKKALKAGLAGAGYGAMVGFIVGGIPGMVVGAFVGAAIGMLISWMSSDTSIAKKDLIAAMRSKINMNAQKGGLAAGGIAGFLVGGPIGMLAGAMIGLAVGTVMKALTADTTFARDQAMAELKKGALFAGIGGIGGAILGSFFGPGGTIVGAFVGAILGLAINAAHESVIKEKLNSEKTKGILPALEIILQNIFEFIGDTVLQAMNGVIKLINSILPDWIGKIDEFKVDTPEMNKAQRDQISAAAKVREIQAQPDRITDDASYKKLPNTSTEEIENVAKNTGFNLLDAIKNVYTGSTKGGPGEIETQSLKLLALWKAQKRLSDAIDAEAKAKYIRDVGTPEEVSGMSEIRRQQLAEESLKDESVYAARGTLEYNEQKKEAERRAEEKKEERKRIKTFAAAMKAAEKERLAAQLEKKAIVENYEQGSDGSYVPPEFKATGSGFMNMLETIRKDAVSDKMSATSGTTGTTVVTDNSVINQGGSGGQDSASFQNLGYIDYKPEPKKHNLRTGR